ncbi:MAG: glycosyltransferase family 2 protein [Bacteroidales bacterium]|nr:glycosyltransferase family 2 protein [Candidatus Scybalousia scybalohippi]
MNKKIAIVILNWNGREKGLIDKYLPSVVKYSSNAEVWVADNGSTDDSLDFIHNNFPTVKTIALDKNYGFTGGYNRALNQIEADYFCLLNDDVEVTFAWIRPIIELMESDDKIAICQPKIKSYKDKSSFEYAGAAGGYIDYLGYPFCAGRIFENLEKDTNQYETIREIFWATGAAMFVKADIFKTLGGLDEDFFAHMEEIDFCWRVKNNGYKVMYCPQSTVYHYGGATLNKINPKKTYLNFRNNLLILYKNLPEKKLRSVLRKRKYMDMLAAVVFLLTTNRQEYKAVLQARKDFYSMLPQFKEKRMKNIEEYPSCVLKKSLVLCSKLWRKNKFTDYLPHLSK